MFNSNGSSKWWLAALGGIALIALGVGTLAFPGLSLMTLVFMMGGLFIADGGYRVATAVSERKERDNGWLGLLGGILSIGAGVIVMAAPSLTALSLVLFVAVWMIFTGMMDIANGIGEKNGRLANIAIGLLGIIAGTLIYTLPIGGALSLMWVAGLYAIVLGIVRVGSLLKALDTRSAAQVAG